MTSNWIEILSGHSSDIDVFKSVSNCLEIINKINWQAEIIAIELQKARERCFGLVSNLGENEQAARVCVSVMCDLRGQGWIFKVIETSIVGAQPSSKEATVAEEKARIRSGLLIERNSQLQTEAAKNFVKRMERQHVGPDGWTSIFSLMRDGQELAQRLEAAAQLSRGASRNDALRNIIDPYIQVVDDSKCKYTGLALKEIWRYFRYTWVNPFKTVPGRNIWLLIRDRSVEHHPIIGIAALGSSIVQMTERDKWIGWDRKTFIKQLQQNPDSKWLDWIEQSFNKLLRGIYVQDLLEKKVITENDLATPQDDVIERLLKLSGEAREGHRLFPKTAEHKKGKVKSTVWQKKAETYLFVSKRTKMLANLLRAKKKLIEAGFEQSNPASLKRVLNSKAGRAAIGEILRRVKATHVGVKMMDLTVCGAVPPYNPILGGKLVSLLMTSPEVAKAYYDRYQDRSSIIASSMAGAPVVREPKLVFLGTTSLYGVGSSQYNRLKLPANKIGGQTGQEIRYFELGHTKGYGSYHFSKETLEEIEVFLAQNGDARRVNSIFGEGVNPRLRKVRDALGSAGLSSEILLKHGNQRLIYGIPLATNFRDILLGIDDTPEYIFPSENPKETTSRIADFWIDRWLSRRIEKKKFLTEVAKHSLIHPIDHGARVKIPKSVRQLTLFHDL